MYNNMTVQTAFRLEESMVKMMKQRARLRRQSVNAYVAELIAKDLRNSSILPTVELPAELDSDIARLAGSMCQPALEDIENDERLRRIWER